MVAVLAGKGVIEDVRPASCGGSVRFSWVGGLYQESKCPRLNRNYKYIALEIEKTQVVRRPTPRTIVKAGLEAGMKAWHDAGFGSTGTVLPKDGGPRFKGMNSLKLSGILFKAETAVELCAVPLLQTPI
ncbi:hypothetical protein CRG98_038943 [Punica granatum]|uniref:Uncharacterized protein n=1 Tax=Punica granatum TaxID=22663 RepID=A0A2I0I9L5_PUNGR|nr:hypothetical protein CRG98_038943 [Punica granatum]